MTKAADAIGLAALRAPGAQRVTEREKGAPAPRRRRRLRLRFGRMMFAAVVVYLVGAGAVGQLQLMRMQSAEHAVTKQLAQENLQNQALERKIGYLRTKSGQAAAVRGELHYAPSGATRLVVKSAP